MQDLFSYHISVLEHIFLHFSGKKWLFKTINGFLAKVSLSHFSGAASRGSKKTDEETRGKLIQESWTQLVRRNTLLLININAAKTQN